MKKSYWTSRILAIVFNLFLVLFAFDVFGQGYSTVGAWLEFAAHLLPNLLLLIVTLVAWKKPIIGGPIFLLLGGWYAYLMIPQFRLLTVILLAGIPIIIGVLFTMEGIKKRKEKKEEPVEIPKAVP